MNKKYNQLYMLQAMINHLKYTWDFVILLSLFKGWCTQLNLSKLTTERDQISDKAPTVPKNPFILHPVDKN